jgi:hypothetical protein
MKKIKQSGKTQKIKAKIIKKKKKKKPITLKTTKISKTL